MTAQEILRIEGDIVERLKTVFDPEIPVNIYDLGLIYNIDVEANGVANITMTLTAPNCPMADEILEQVKKETSAVEGVTEAKVEIVFEPPWNQEMISEEALLELGLL